MKCSECIFAKNIDNEIIECRNLFADDNGCKLFKKWDGCGDGRANTAVLNAQEIFSLKHNMY